MVHWGGLCCLGAAALYILSRRTGRDVEFLKSVTRVDQLGDLAKLIEEESRVIAVSGRVSSETPVKCTHSGILAAIVEETAEQQFLKRNWKFSWVQDCALMLPISKESPWFLHDGTGRVTVAEAQSAIGFALTVASEVYEKPEPSSLVGGTLDYLRGLKMLGIRRIERVLPIGTRLTVVGQAVKDGIIGDVRIQKPEQGPFYVSPVPLDQLISKLGKWSRRFKNVSMGLTLLGVILISKPVVKYILVRIGDILETRRLQLLRKRVVDAAAKKTEEDGPDLCVICLERKCNAAFVECGHMCCCITCSLKLQGKTCPLCREPVVAPVLKVYRN